MFSRGRSSVSETTLGLTNLINRTLDFTYYKSAFLTIRETIIRFVNLDWRDYGESSRSLRRVVALLSAGPFCWQLPNTEIMGSLALALVAMIEGIVWCSKTWRQNAQTSD